jgi:hypothetical protein
MSVCKYVKVMSFSHENRARICKPLKEPRNRLPSWGAGTTTLFEVRARQATLAGWIDSLESIPVLLKRLQNRPPDNLFLSPPAPHPLPFTAQKLSDVKSTVHNCSPM